MGTRWVGVPFMDRSCRIAARFKKGRVPILDGEMQMKKRLWMGLEVVATRRHCCWPGHGIAGISVDGKIQDRGSTESEALHALWRRAAVHAGAVWQNRPK
jgi:hypothetical protein